MKTYMSFCVYLETKLSKYLSEWKIFRTNVEKINEIGIYVHLSTSHAGDELIKQNLSNAEELLTLCMYTSETVW